MKTLALVLCMLLPASALAQELSVQLFSFDAPTHTYKMHICGFGSASLGVYYHRTSAPTSSDSPDATQGAAACTYGVCGSASNTLCDLTVTHPNTQTTGLYQSYAFIDWNDSYTETNEADNLAGPIEICIGPDVHLEKFSIDKQGATVTYKARVCNKGSRDALKFRVGVWHNQSSKPKPSDMGDVFKGVAKLAPGACKDLDIAGGLRPNGSFVAWAAADSGDFQVECREKNNFVGPINYTLSNPDLEVSNFKAKVSGSTVTYTLKVCNQGTEDVKKFFTDIYYHRPKKAPSIGDPGDVAKPTLQLKANGACTNLSFVRTNVPKGTYYSYVFADPDDFISEPKEHNNMSTALIVKVGGGSPGDGGSTDGDGGMGKNCTDADGDGYGVGPGCQGVPDCDDADDKLNPGAKEICGDNIDQDCDLTPDDGCPGVACKDSDGDGWGVGKDCVLPDCNDADKSVYPWAKEMCGDNKDDNCNKIADDGCPGRQCVDQDMDGYGVGKGCPGPQDCADDDRTVKPGPSANETACGDGLDNDCDGTVDDGCSGSTDSDGDGAGVGAGAGQNGQPPDCDDSDPKIGPGQKEVCGDGLDNDCDGTVDDGCPGVDCKDGDGDGWGVGKDCAIQDCNDKHASVHPWAKEICDLTDNIDQDCDGTINDGCPGVDCKDGDGDGWGKGASCCNDTSSKVTCVQDCNDDDGGTSPWVSEICSDNLDNDCDGSIDESCPLCDDRDADGHGVGPRCSSWDCDDSDPSTFPGAPEICNGTDNDCDGVKDDDCTGGNSGCGCHLGAPHRPFLALGLLLALALATLVMFRRRDA